jgi:VCBS repeat-containing protein
LSGVFIDGTAPPIVNRVLSNDGANNLTFQFETNEPLDAINVTVDGPNTADVYSFDESDFTETTVSGDFDIQYTLSTPPPYDDGRGTYAATIDAAVDTVGNDGSTGTSVTYELPTANDESFTTDEDTELSVDAPGVLSNDSPLSPENDSVSVLRVQGSSENRGNDITLDSDAVLTLNADGSFTYDPAGAFEDFAATDDSTDTFEYQAVGPDGGTSNTATVSVTINGVNDAPQIVNNSVLGLPSGSEAVISDDLLQVDDPDNGAATLTFTLEDEPVNGDVLNNGTPLRQGDTFSQQDINDGKIKYDHGGSGETDNFDFTVSDGDKGISETEFTISIGTNDSPTANNDNATTTEDDVLDVTDPSNGVLANDSDPDGDDLFVSEVNGTPNEEDPVTVRGNSDIVIDSSGTYTFDPKDEFQSLDDGDNATPVVTYTAADGKGGRAQASLNLTVEGENDPPTLATNDGLDGVRIGARESILSLNLRAEDVDGDDGASNLTFKVQTPPSNGQLFNGGSPLNADDTFTQADINDGNIAYQHDGSTTSSDSFTFTLRDDSGDGPSEATFAISISAGIPTARNDTFVVGQNSSLAVTPSGAGVLDNDSDPTQDDLTASIVALTGPENGTLDDLTNFSDGFFTYTPDDGFSGRDSVDYSATDPAGNADTAAVQIAVLPATEQYVTTQGQAVSIPAPDTAVLGPEAGQAVDTLGEVSVSSAPSDGSVTFSDDTFEYTPDNGFSGTDAFEYEVGNGLGGTVSAGISVRVRPLQESVSVRRSFPNPTDSTSFRLVALPGSPGVSLASTLTGEQGDDWRGFQEGGATENASFSREPCGTEATCSLTAGTGYWLIARSDWSVDDNIGAVSLQPDDGGSVPSVVRIPVQDGWNIISNPLVEDVSWEDVQDASGTDQDLFRWRDGWLETQTFGSATSGEAYYFRDDDLDALVVPFPGVQRKDAGEPTEETKTKRPPKGRTLALHAVQNGDTLSTVRAGRHPDSKRGFDDTDRYGPPGYFGASLRLLPPGTEQPPALRTEYKPPNGDGSAFALRLRTSADSALTLTTEGADAFSDDEVALVNRSSGRSHDLKATPAVTVAPSSSTTRFKLLVGSAAFVDKAQQEVIPDEVKLRPNYPNPFRRTTTIEYSLPSAQDVRLVVYDVLGRRVETIVDGRQEAGFHTLQWDGGRSLASGMYFARLVAGSTTKTERLVIIR